MWLQGKVFSTITLQSTSIGSLLHSISLEWILHLSTLTTFTLQVYLVWSTKQAIISLCWQGKVFSTKTLQVTVAKLTWHIIFAVCAHGSVFVTMTRQGGQVWKHFPLHGWPCTQDFSHWYWQLYFWCSRSSLWHTLAQRCLQDFNGAAQSWKVLLLVVEQQISF